MGQPKITGGVYNMNGKTGQEDYYPNTTFIAKTEHMNVGPNIKSEPGKFQQNSSEKPDLIAQPPL